MTRSRSQHICGRRKTVRLQPSKSQERALAGKRRTLPNRRWAKKHQPRPASSIEVAPVSVVAAYDWKNVSIHAARIAEMRVVARKKRLADGAAAVQEEIGQMDKREENQGRDTRDETETPTVFSMRVKPVKANEHEAALGSDIARALTGLMTAGRGGFGGLVDAGTRFGAILVERGGDLVERLQVATMFDDLYAMLGIASTAALVALDERVDDVELKMDGVARQRTRKELMLLHQRLGELEAAVRLRGDNYDPVIDLGGVMGRLNEIESRIDEIPWSNSSG